MKKFIILLIIFFGIWFYINPIGKISKVSKGLIIYSGVPIINFDLIIKPNGHFEMSDHSYDKIDHYDLIKEVTSDILGVNGKYNYVVIGQGVGVNKIKISKKLLDLVSRNGVKVYKGSSKDMMIKYNLLKKKKYGVLGIFSTGFPRKDISSGIE